jgi:hypothetical protein
MKKDGGDDNDMSDYNLSSAVRLFPGFFRFSVECLLVAELA